MPLERPRPKVRDGAGLLDPEAEVRQPLAHGLGMEVEVERGELHRLTAKWTPSLPAQPVAQDGLEIALVGIFQDKDRTRLEYPPHLGQGPGRILHVVQGADHGRAVEQVRHERQPVDIGGHIDVARGVTEPRPRLLELGARVVQKNDPLVPGVAGRVAPGTGAQFQQPAPGGRQEVPQRDGFGAILVLTPALLPEGGLVVGALVIADGGRFSAQSSARFPCR